MSYFAPVLARASLVTLRLFNVYGPGQDSRFVVPALLRQVRARFSFLCVVLVFLSLAGARSQCERGCCVGSCCGARLFVCG